jgi:Zn-dependent metalloprotease
MIWSVVETQMVSSSWTAVATTISAGISAITPVMLFFYLQMQKTREKNKVILLATVAENQKAYQNETKVSLALLTNVTAQTHVLVNSRFGEVLRTLSSLARNHAVMAQERADRTKSPGDRHIAELAIMAADAAERELQSHDDQQKAADLKEGKDAESAEVYMTLKEAGKLPIKDTLGKLVADEDKAQSTAAVEKLVNQGK